MKLKIKDKIKKQDVILFICIFIFAMIANNAFLQRHYSSDTMCLIELGYFKYPLKYFLLDGRIFSALLSFLGGFLNLPVDVYQFISNFIGIVLLTISVIMIYKFTINYLEIEDKWVKILTLLSVYTIIFNHMSIEYLLFPESCIMCAGVLFSIFASISYLKKNNIRKSFILLTLSVLCYQGIINIFPILVITLMFLKTKSRNKETLKVYIKEIIKLGIMFVLSMLISMGLIFMFNNILQNSTNRLERIGNIFDFIIIIPKYMLYTLILQTNKIPLYLSIIVIFITCIIILRYNRNLLLKYILIVITAYIFCIVPIFAYGYIQARMLMAVGSLMGISILFITFLLNTSEEKILSENIKSVIISVFVIAYFIFNIIINYMNGYEHLKAFALDEEIGGKINQIIKNYEEDTGIEVTKFAYLCDPKNNRQEKGIEDLGSLTERKFLMPWSIEPSLNYYCNKKLEKVAFSREVYQEHFYGKDYTEFSEEQIVFVNDTLYMYVY